MENSDEIKIGNCDCKEKSIMNSRQRYMKLYKKCHANFSNYLQLYKNKVRLLVRNQNSRFYCLSKIKANDYIKSHQNVQSDVISSKTLKKKSNLTPLPYKSYKRITSSKEQKDLISLERNAVVMRMIEYTQKTKFNKLIKNKYIHHIKSIILLQKNIRGFLLRKTCCDIEYLYSKMELFITHLKRYSLIAKRAHYKNNIRIQIPNTNSKNRHNNIKLVKNVNKFLSKQVCRIPTNKIGGAYKKNSFIRNNKPPTKPKCKLNININSNNNSNSVLAHYLNNFTSDNNSAYTAINTNTNPTSKSTFRLSKRGCNYSQHNCISFDVVSPKNIKSIGVQTAFSNEENGIFSQECNNVESNLFHTYRHNTCVINKEQECVSDKKNCSHMGMKCFASLRLTQDKSYEGESHQSEMMMSSNVMSRIKSIEFEYVPEVNIETINLRNDNQNNNFETETNLSQFSIEEDNNSCTEHNNNQIQSYSIKQFPKELSDNSYTKIILHSPIHSKIMSYISVIQNQTRKYLLSKHIKMNNQSLCKIPIYYDSYLTKVNKVMLINKLNVIETAIKRMLFKKGFYNKKIDPTFLAMTLLIVKRFNFSVKFHVFRFMKRKYFNNVIQSESMNTLQDDYELNEERSSKLKYLFNEVIFDMKKDNVSKFQEVIEMIGVNPLTSIEHNVK